MHGSVRVQSTIDPEWARSRGFVVIPVPGQELEAISLGQLSRAIQQMGIDEVLAVHSGRPPTKEELEHSERARKVWPDAIYVPTFFVLSASPEDIYDVVYKEHASFEHFLTDRDVRFAILLTHDETSLVAGPKEFVEAALGKTLTEAWKDFEIYVEEMRPYGVDWWLRNLIDLYRPLSTA
ncbi:MAG: hypothetical protein HY678_04340 [Chloroflexi bacterium]|nr:hypothetical protein [Chloroflexota bacterium]